MDKFCCIVFLFNIYSFVYYKKIFLIGSYFNNNRCELNNVFFFDKEVIKWFYFDKDENVFFCLVKGYENVYKGIRIKKGRVK